MTSSSRIVITGLGVLAPNAHGLKDFEVALRNCYSGIRHSELLQKLNFSCQVVGVPQNIDTLKQQYLSTQSLMAMNSSMIFAAIAAIDCWRDAGFKLIDPSENIIDWDTGAIIGTGVGGCETIGGPVAQFTDQGKVKRLGSTMVEQAMSSAASANVGGLLGLGGQVTTNSSACSTGTEAIINAFWAIKEKRAKRMLAGATEGASQYTWATFDAMRVLARGFNDTPQQASRPMSQTASGFVPGSGAGVLMLESLESAEERGAKIYAEIIGVHVNCGGQRNGGSISAPNPAGVVRCIQEAITMAKINYKDIDLINGHLTATMADTLEINNWQKALKCQPSELPPINSTKSLIGHSLGAAGAIECVASILQLCKGFIHGSINCEDLHFKLEQFSDSIIHKTKETDLNVLAKASFGFGDVNACLIFKRWN
ncbi:MAG: beta-ketoacyl-[acyl-carrier-protein] synthase family protein [Gammaproteobacteria bacterium]|jgi:3-oxoacyl-(acyl-carrier-protein) synthase